MNKKENEYTLDDSYVSFQSDQSDLKNTLNVNDIMKLSSIPLGHEQCRELPRVSKKILFIYIDDDPSTKDENPKPIRSNKMKHAKKPKSKQIELSDEILNDVKVIQMRSIFDKKRFYKKNDIMPSKYIQIGRVVDAPADFYSSRLPKKLRKRTLVDELLSDAKFKKEIKKSYVKIVNEKKFNPTKYKKWKKKISKNCNKTC